MSAPGRFRALRPEYLAATGGNACAALTLDLFAYWTNVRTANSAQAESGGKEGNDLWFYRSLADISADLFDAFGRAAIRSALKLLEDGGLIESRTNPASPWDRTLQYRLTERVGNRILHGAKPDDVQDAKPDDDAGARPSQPSAAQAKQPEERTKNGRAPAVDDEQRTVSDLFEHWQLRCNHPTSKPTRERRQKIAARLREGYTVEQIRAAIDGAARDPFVNDAGKRFDDLELICRTGSKLESFIDRAAPPLASNGTVHPIRQQQGKPRNSNGKPTHAELIRELRAANPRLHPELAANHQLPART